MRAMLNTTYSVVEHTPVTLHNGMDDGPSVGEQIEKVLTAALQDHKVISEVALYIEPADWRALQQQYDDDMRRRNEVSYAHAVPVPDRMAGKPMFKGPNKPKA